MIISNAITITGIRSAVSEPFVIINGLAGSEARPGSTLTMSASQGAISGRRWGSTPGGAQYGTGTSPTAFTTGTLFATAAIDGVQRTRSAPIRYARATLTGATSPAEMTVGEAVDIDYAVFFSAPNLISTIAVTGLPSGVVDDGDGTISGAPDAPTFGTITATLTDQYGREVSVTQAYTALAAGVVATAPAQATAPALTATETAITATLGSDPADGGSPITARQVRVREVGGSFGDPITATSPQAITGLVASTGYEVQARVGNAVGFGDWSTSATITTQDAAPVATAPAQMAAPSLTADETTITATLAADPDDGGAAITSRQIRSRAVGGTFGNAITVTSPHTITGLIAETGYEVQARAVNSVGAGPWSLSASITTDAAPVDPPAPGWAVTNNGGGTFSLTSSPGGPTAPIVVTNNGGGTFQITRS